MKRTIVYGLLTTTFLIFTQGCDSLGPGAQVENPDAAPWAYKANPPSNAEMYPDATSLTHNLNSNQRN